MLLSAEHIDKNYGLNPLLEGAGMYVDDDSKVGIIGINGTGKSTLLRILAGLEEPDGGQVMRANGMRLGYLEQNPAMDEGVSALEYVVKGANARRYEAQAVLNRLKILDHDQPIGQLSGGQRKRVALAAVLVHPADLYILDEPTNHLDSDMVEWLEEYLRAFRGGIVMVTHDRYFLENVANSIVELENAQLISYPANYSEYLEMKAERQAMDQSSDNRRRVLLKKELEWAQRGAKARTTKAKGRLQKIEQLKEGGLPADSAKVQMSTASSRLGKQIIEMEGLSKGFDGHFVLKDFSYNLLRDDRIGLVGGNGTGKSTLLNLIAGTLEPDEGVIVRGATVKIGYFAQHTQGIDGDITALEYVSRVAPSLQTAKGQISASQMLEQFLFPPALQRTPIHRFSGGEKRRLFLLRELMGAPNVLLLDEPTNDLDIQTLTILEDYLDDFEGAVIAASHDRYFLDRIATQVFETTEDGQVFRYLGGYTDYVSERKEREGQRAPTMQEDPGKAQSEAMRTRRKPKFTFNEQRDYETIEERIALAEQKVQAIEAQMAEHSSDYVELERLGEQKSQANARLDELTERWLYLEDLAEQIAQQQ